MNLKRLVAFAVVGLVGWFLLQVFLFFFDVWFGLPGWWFSKPNWVTICMWLLEVVVIGKFSSWVWSKLRRKEKINKMRKYPRSKLTF